MTLPVHLVTGHLGAGKTSVLRHLLARRPVGERVGLVVNDFGEARIDESLLDSLVLEHREISGSCVCCTAPAGFAAAVASMIGRVDVLFVEPTGLARPADLVDTLRRAPFAADLDLRPLVVVVDAAVGGSEHPDHDVLDGLAVAEVVVVNRLDRATPASRATLTGRLAALWPGPRLVLETSFGVVSDEVLAPGDGTARTAPHHHHHAPDHDVVVHTLVRAPELVFGRDALVAWLSDPAWLRAKGLVRTDEGWLEVQRAGDQVTAVPTDWRRDSRLDLLARSGVTAPLGAFDGLVRPAGTGGDLEVAWPGGSRSFDRAALARLPGLADVGGVFPGRVGRGAWLSALLAAAGAPELGQVTMTARDGYVTAPVGAEALSRGVVVFASGEDELPAAQGGPFRVLVPGGVACANVKAVARIVVRD